VDDIEKRMATDEAIDDASSPRLAAAGGWRFSDGVRAGHA
jgi:hypothetical protein